MDWLKRNPLFALTLLLCAAAVSVEVYFLQDIWPKANRALRQLEQKKQELTWLQGTSPSLTEENVTAIGDDVVGAEKQLAAVRAALAGKGKWLSSAPARPRDAYFSIATFIEQSRAMAVRQQVALRPEERFGFTTHANEGPETELIPAVHLQRTVIEYLLETLFEARPRSLVSVQRERPLTETQRAARRAVVEGDASSGRSSHSSGQLGDFFEPDPRLRVHVANHVDSEGFRIEFTGQTQTLRAFLNALSLYKLPLIVRIVEVEPMPSELAGHDDSTAVASSAPVPLVSQNFSKFAVVVEYIEVLPLAITPTS